MDSNYPTMGDIAWDAAQTQKREIEELRKRIEALEREVRELLQLVTPITR